MTFFCIDILTLCTASPEYKKRKNSVAMSVAVMACQRGSYIVLIFLSQLDSLVHTRLLH
jgi:sulfur relay (sulfurtransferase) complex TusBCD TusD component (DsrE family)